MTSPRKSKADGKGEITRRKTPRPSAKLDAHVTEVAETQQQSWWEVEDNCLANFSEPNKRGPKSKLGLHTIRLRNELVMFLEEHWPELQDAFRPGVSEAIRVARLKAIQQIAGGVPVQHLITNARTLTELLRVVKRTHNNPREIANCIAGVPLRGFWRSQRYCQSHPCQSAIGLRAVRAHIERRHERLAESLALVKPGDILGYRNAIKFYDLRDKKIARCKKDWRYLAEVWEQGVSRLDKVRSRWLK
jgi:hypothetical protein